MAWLSEARGKKTIIVLRENDRTQITQVILNDVIDEEKGSKLMIAVTEHLLLGTLDRATCKKKKDELVKEIMDQEKQSRKEKNGKEVGCEMSGKRRTRLIFF